MRKRPSAALVVAIVALVFSLAGTAEAAFVITKNSQVGPNTIAGHDAPSGKHPNLIAGSVGSKDLHAGAVTGPKLGPQSVTVDKIAGITALSHGTANESELDPADGTTTTVILMTKAQSDGFDVIGTCHRSGTTMTAGLQVDTDATDAGVGDAAMFYDSALSNGIKLVASDGQVDAGTIVSGTSYDYRAVYFAGDDDGGTIEGVIAAAIYRPGTATPNCTFNAAGLG